MDNLTVEERIAKIKELAGDDISVIINMRFNSGINIVPNPNCIISNNVITNSGGEPVIHIAE